MKAKPGLLRVALITSALACALALSPATKPSAQQAEERGATIVNIRTEDGKELRLYDKSYALVIGVSDYTSGWPRLPGVKKDIEEVALALERQGFLVTVVKNPDSAQLDKAFKAFIDEHGMNVENRLLIYFAGHGHTLRQSYGDEMGYIVPSDAPDPKRDQSGFMSKAMDMQQMELYARRIQSKHALFLFDSCFSGSIFAPSRAVPDAITYKTARPVRQFITSGSADETVPDQSIFRRQFIEAIEGEADLNRDGYVTGMELGEFLQDKVINYSRNTQHPQYGKLHNSNLDKGDFVFALPKKPTPPPVAVKPNVGGLPVSPARPNPGTVVRTRSGIEVVYIPPGSFMMGSEIENTQKPVHRVTILEGFYMGKYEVTQAQWRVVMGNSPSNFKGDNLPVEQVSWNDAQEFIQKLNATSDDFTYRLPSEAEWEYACNARPTGGKLDLMAWYFDNSGNRTHPVGRKQPEAFGLYDMRGNVDEWCEDWAHDSYAGAPADGSAWLSGGEQKDRVLRGGSWENFYQSITPTIRVRSTPDFRGDTIGFRVVAVAR
jgi:formylglycine-generating enzyme required for sulfatase activity